MRLAGTTLERNAPIPQFRVAESSTDREFTPWDVKGRRALVLAFLHEDCAECAAFAEEIAARREQFDVADASVYAVASAPLGPVPTLLDPEGDVARAYLGEDGELPTVILADRYGAAWAAYPGFDGQATGLPEGPKGPAHDLPTVGELAATAWHMALQCADCAVPVWPEG